MTASLATDLDALRAATSEYFAALKLANAADGSYPLGSDHPPDAWPLYYERKRAARDRLDAATARLRALAGAAE